MFSKTLIKWVVWLPKAGSYPSLRLAVANRVPCCYPRSCECHHPWQLSPLRASPGCLSRVGKGVARELSSLFFLKKRFCLPWALSQGSALCINEFTLPSPLLQLAGSWELPDSEEGSQWQTAASPGLTWNLSILGWLKRTAEIRARPSVRCSRFPINAVLQFNTTFQRVATHTQPLLF